MEFDELLEIVDQEPVFETALLLAGDRDPDHIRRQLSRWFRAGQIYQLRRGLYALAPPYQKVMPHPFTVANRIVPASYVSLHSALAYYDLIPEHAPVVTSTTTRRPGQWDTPLGSYAYRHVSPAMFFGYQQVQFARSQSAFVASPEKALLDLVYLTPRSDRVDYLDELRLQNLDQLHPEQLDRMASKFDRPKIHRAVAIVKRLRERETQEYRDA